MYDFFKDLPATLFEDEAMALLFYLHYFDK